MPQEAKAVQLKLEPRHWGCQTDRGKQRASSRALPREQGALRGAVGQRGRCKWAEQLPLCWPAPFPLLNEINKKVMGNYRYHGRVFLLHCKISVSFLPHNFALLNVYFYRQISKMVIYTIVSWILMGFFMLFRRGITG